MSVDADTTVGSEIKNKCWEFLDLICLISTDYYEKKVKNAIPARLREKDGGGGEGGKKNMALYLFISISPIPHPNKIFELTDIINILYCNENILIEIKNLPEEISK